jgi:hypothetical protein
MNGMRSAKWAIFFELQFIRSIPFVFCCCVVSVFTFFTTKGNNVPHDSSPLLKRIFLFDDIADDAGTDRATAFTDGKP